MAIYHLSTKIVSRSAGRSVVAAAAYRSGSDLYDVREDKTFEYSRKAGVEHTEILVPPGAPAWASDRSELWNTVESVEKRKDAQLAREIEVALPVELSPDEQVALVRDFARRQLVSRGMVVDFAVHRDNPENPHAHLLMPTRSLGPNGFGPKERSWNERAQLLAWRASWAEVSNEHLAKAGLAIQIDHRTLEAQGSDLTPGRKIGVGLARQADGEELPGYLAERVAQSRAIAFENGEKILADPDSALSSLTRQQATFTERDVAKFLHTRTDGADQFQRALLKVTTSPEVVSLGRDDRGRERFTTREMLTLETELLDRAERLAVAPRQGAEARRGGDDRSVTGRALSEEQAQAVDHLTEGRGLSVLVGVAGAGKSTALEAARVRWEAAGLSVKGAALSGIAAENLENASGIGSRTLASWARSWENGRDELTSRDVLVIDEAGMVGTRQLGKVLERAEAAGAKVVLVGDPEQLQAIEAGAPFRGIAAQAGVVELTEVRRQAEGWQREATRNLSRGETEKALAAYESAGQVVATETHEEARARVLEAWRDAGDRHPGQSRLLLAYTRDDVQQLNAAARSMRLAAGELGRGEVIETAKGKKEFAAGDRLYFLRNERSLGVRNGSLGTVERVEGGVLQVRLDGSDGQRVAVDSRFYTDLDHGYAATVHKAQGATVDRTFVLASKYFDRHVAYVALSRHRESATLVYGRDQFGGGDGEGADVRARQNLGAVLSRARPKELAVDYVEPEGRSASVSPSVSVQAPTTATVRGVESQAPAPRQTAAEIQRAGREAWLSMRLAQKAAAEQGPEAEGGGPARPRTLEEERALAVERWKAYREQAKNPPQAGREGPSGMSGPEVGSGPARIPSRELDGPEID